MQFSRREVVATSVLVTIAGCTSGSGDGGGEGTQIEYTIGDRTTHEGVPEAIVEHANQDGFAWYVVSIDVQNGEIDAADLIGLTQLEVGEATEAVRGVQADGNVATDESSDLSITNSGDVFYRVSADASGDVAWIIDQLENQYDGAEIVRGSE